MDNVISLVVWAKLTDFTADLTFGSCFVKSEVNLKSPWQPRYPYHLISLPSTGCFEELGLSYKGFSLVRLVIKTNREHSTFTGVSFSFYLPLCQHTHLHLPPHFSQHCLSCILPKFNFCSTSVSTIFFFPICFFEKQRHMLISPSVRNGTQQARIPSSKYSPLSSSFLPCRSKSRGLTHPGSATFQEVN